jgi:hypothetical protein
MHSIFKKIETFCGGRYGRYFSNEMLHIIFGLMVQKL